MLPGFVALFMDIYSGFFFGRISPTHFNSSWRILEFLEFFLEFFWFSLEFFEKILEVFFRFCLSFGVLGDILRSGLSFYTQKQNQISNL